MVWMQPVLVPALLVASEVLAAASRTRAAGNSVACRTLDVMH